MHSAALITSFFVVVASLALFKVLASEHAPSHSKCLHREVKDDLIRIYHYPDKCTEPDVYVYFKTTGMRWFPVHFWQREGLDYFDTFNMSIGNDCNIMFWKNHDWFVGFPPYPKWGWANREYNFHVYPDKIEVEPSEHTHGGGSFVCQQTHIRYATPDEYKVRYTRIVLLRNFSTGVDLSMKITARKPNNIQLVSKEDYEAAVKSQPWDDGEDDDDDYFDEKANAERRAKRRQRIKILKYRAYINRVNLSLSIVLGIGTIIAALMCVFFALYYRSINRRNDPMLNKRYGAFKHS